MSNKNISIEEILERIYFVHGDNISLVEYGGKTQKVKSLFKCNICGNEWETTCDSVIRGSGCFNCVHKKLIDKQRLSVDDVRREIESKNCKLISREYKNNRENLEIEFECGHVGYMSLYAFQQGQRCKCDSKIRFKKTIEEKTRNKILEFAYSIGFEILSFENDFASYDNDLTYRCQNGHVETRGTREFLSNKNCRICTQIKVSESQRGSKGNNWKGGRDVLRKYLKNKITQWKKDSIENCNYRCVITGERFDHVHHLYPFNSIVQDALEELGLEKYEFVGEYSDEELSPIIDKVKEIHYRYPLGVCLRKDIHKLFHKLYGLENNFPEQFYEFVDRIKSGEIEINN